MSRRAWSLGTGTLLVVLGYVHTILRVYK